MPLNTRKLAHIKKNLARTHAGRAQQLTLTLRTAGGGTSTLVVNAVWRVQADGSPTMEGPSPQVVQHGINQGLEQEVFAIFLATDVTLTQLRATIFATPTITTNQPAVKYLLLSVEPIGIGPGGDRFLTRWARR